MMADRREQVKRKAVLHYKVLNNDGTCCNGGTGKWYLPQGKSPGKWMPPVHDIQLCARGYHLCTLEQLIPFLGPAIYVAEGRGPHVEDESKSAWSEARLLYRTVWDAKAARLFASDCAEHVLPIYEKRYPSDTRVRDCISTARQYALGIATEKQLAAAWAAARDAGAAAEAAWAARAAEAAAEAARAAEAAWAAARAAEAAAEAARAAARAAEAAAEAAWAARAAEAAWAAARDAGAAAWDAERQWQTKRLMEYLKITCPECRRPTFVWNRRRAHGDEDLHAVAECVCG